MWVRYRIKAAHEFLEQIGAERPLKPGCFDDLRHVFLGFEVLRRVIKGGFFLRMMIEEKALRFAQEGEVNVFYWVNGPFGYAISANADKAELARVSGEVYRQLDAVR